MTIHAKGVSQMVILCKQRHRRKSGEKLQQASQPFRKHVSEDGVIAKLIKIKINPVFFAC